jgi:starch phosphorylase
MWRGVADGAPILGITNGVHVPTWQDARVRVAQSPYDLWRAHQVLKGDLCAAIYGRTAVPFDEDRLLIGFARRATAYKRPDLVLGDPARLDALLAAGRVQLVFAGKAHPADAEGQAAIARIVAAARRWPRQVVFLEDYDLELGALLTRGCDVWLNNPRPPLEASGTSGMKAALNGALNVSVLDGWWPEGCRHGETGWSFGGPTADDDRDRAELYALLESEVIPRYYDDRPGWIKMMTAAIEMARTRFSSERMLGRYYRLLYEPCARGRGGDVAHGDAVG